MTDWIKHVPGDPMPVDGDAEVYVRFADGQEGGKSLAKNWAWFPVSPNKATITAYRIHKPEEREMKYKAGDRVTLQIDVATANQLNSGHGLVSTFYGNDVIAHEPAPEPVVGYVFLTEDKTMPFSALHPSHVSNGNKYPRTAIRLTVFPATKEVKAEVVE